MKKTLLLIIFSLSFTACKWFKAKPEIGLVLSKHFHNKLYKKFDTAAYNLVFNKELNNSGLSNPKVTRAFYKAHENEPVLITRFYVNGGLDSLKHYIENSKADGFNPGIFHLESLDRLLNTLNANRFKNIDEVYPLIAKLELKTADALLKYHIFIKYGSINPRRLFSRYYIPVNRPDSLQLDSVLNTTDMVKVLSSSQPKLQPYLELKKALAWYRDSLKTDQHATINLIKLNMERLRWEVPVQTEEVVRVNIPDFSLTWFDKKDTLIHMKVCLGAKREADYAEKMKRFLKSGKLDDKPKNHETPQLLSVFNAIQVNPIWNIPVSIAQSEIYNQAIKDPYYLTNNNIKVYRKGKAVADPDTITWANYTREKLPFQFKQGSGEGNALGKFKFAFDNSSSIYLHDTNNKSGFKLANRAISHGCVRLERPLDFAKLLVKDKYQYDKLRMEVDLPPIDTAKLKQFKQRMAKKADTLNLFKLKPAWFATRKNITIIINYYTAWVQHTKVQFRPDVYGYDEILWTALKKNM